MADQLSLELAPGMQPAQTRGSVPGSWTAPAHLDDEAQPEAPLTRENRCLELALMWEGTLLDVRHYHRPTEVTLGDAPGCDLPWATDGLVFEPFPLISMDGDEVVIAYGGALRGALEHQGQSLPLDASLDGALDTTAPRCAQARLPLHGVATLEIDGLVLRLRYVPRAAPPAASRLKEINYSWLNVLMVSLFAHAAFLGAAALYPHDVSRLNETLFETPNRFVQLIIAPETPQPQQELYQELLAGAEGRSAERFRGQEGAAGDPDAAETDQRRASKGPRESDENLVGRQVAMLFGDVGPGGVGSVLGEGLGGDLEDALGGVTGPTVGASRGLFGLGVRGRGPGGGGDALRTWGIGQIGTRGRGGGRENYGPASGRLRPRGDRDVEVATGRGQICDAFDKEVVRRVIREHLDQIRYCYERELARSPGLHGKIAVRFVIGSHGRVVSAMVAQSTLRSVEVEQCVAGKVRGWIFPKPRGGGIGVVTYPFVFKSSG